MFERFWGNPHVTAALEQMIARGRLAQTLLFAGPEGVGKATLARRELSWSTPSTSKSTRATGSPIPASTQSASAPITLAEP